MKKSICLILLLCLTCTFAGACFPRPFVEQIISVKIDSDKADDSDDETNVRMLYVSGAVVRDGYVAVPQICDYKMLLETVGIAEQAKLPEDIFRLIAPNIDRYIADFMREGVAYSSVNVNGAGVLARREIDGVDFAVVNKLADYIEKNGAITNRNKLKLALGDDYDENYFKFYIDKLDYAQDS